MNLRQLEAFKAVIETGSITAASEVLHVSQPSISRLIADLERSVGFALFLREGRGITATVEARRLYQAVDSVFVGINQLGELADVIRTTAGNVVSIGVIPTFSQILLPHAVANLHEQRRDIRFMISTRNTPAIVDAVRLQQYDLGLVGRSPPYEGVTTLFQTAFQYVGILKADHPAAQDHGPLDLETLAENEKFITFGGAFPDEMMGIDESLSRRLSSNSQLSATNMPTAAALTRETGAISIIDPFTASISEKLGGVVVRELQQPLTYNVALITKGKDTLSMEARELSDILIDNLQKPPSSRLG